MDIHRALINAETKHLKNLEQFTEEVFRDVFLPSHGPEHHRRVWRYGVEIALETDFSGFQDPESFASGLIIACYLHDTGMAFDRGERHGIKSAELCKRFLEKYSLPEKKYAKTIEAIEKHDCKSGHDGDHGNLLSLILNIADDLDAFGYTGIYRYFEIYLERGIPLNILGERILTNASGRFENFKRFYATRKVLFNRHLKRFRIVEEFFRNYIKESGNYRFGTDRPHGYCGIAEVTRLMLHNRLHPVNGLEQSHITRNLNDPVIRWYFSELKKELAAD